MKQDLKTELREKLAGRTALVGIGNPDLGDDALGIRLAEQLQRAGCPNTVVAGTVPENLSGVLARGGYDHVVFLDAVELGAAPGSVVFMDATEIRTQFPQISTHKLSLGMLAQFIETDSRARVWLLGVQPSSLQAGTGLSEPVKQTADLLARLLTEVLCGASSGTKAKCTCT